MTAKPSRKKQLEREKHEGAAPPVSETIEPRRHLVYWLIPASIALATFVAFLPILQNGFVNWDDDAFLLDNPHYRGLGWEQLRWMFTTCYLGSCMPLNYVTYGLDYVIWGMNPVGYHLSSSIIHAANAVLFYFVSLRLLRLTVTSPAVSWQLPIRLAAGVSALLFSLHPLRVGVVGWTLGREIAVAGFFFFLTLICYLKAAENKSIGLSPWKWMGAAWILYALSLLGKEAALTLPVALLVLDVYPLRRLGGAQGRWFGSPVRWVWWEKIPFVLVALVAGVRAVLAKEQSGTIYPVAAYGLAPRLAQVLYSLAFYPWKTLLPVGLSPLYPVHPFTGLWNLPFMLSGALVISLTVGFLIGRHRWPAGLAAWVFYMLLLIPVSGIVTFGPYRADDRFSYLPCLGWAILFGAGLFRCWKLWAAGRFRMGTFIVTQSFAVLILVILGTLTWNQAQVWKDSERLWRHALALEEKSSFAHNNLGLVLAERGALEEAIKEFRRAVEIDPAFVEAQTNLGNFLAQRGAREEAIVHLRHALQIEPAFVNAHNTLGNILADRGALDEAIEHFRKALQTNPQSAMTHYNLGRALAKRGDVEEAIAQYRQALEIDPADVDVHNNLGLLLLSQGNIDQAIEQFHAALRGDPNYAKAYFNLGKVYAEQNRLDEAVLNFQQALRLQPGVAEIHENLARTLARQGKRTEALQEYQEALRLLQLRSEGK
jgi:protein O-mannosyl-transferase